MSTRKEMYEMDATELFLHQLLNDTCNPYPKLEIDELVNDLAKLNWLKQALEINNMDLLQCVIDYRKNILHTLENL